MGMVIDTMVNDLVTDGGESIEVPENIEVYRFVRLVGERIPPKQEGTKTTSQGYRLKGLPKGKDFRKESSYVELKASWLKVEGVGFAGDSFEFSEHETDIIVCQENEGSSAHIYFEPFCNA